MSEYMQNHFNFKGNKYHDATTPFCLIGVDSKGNEFIIDETDYKEVSNYCWTIQNSRASLNGGYFCARKSRKDGHKMMMLHNFIWELHNGKIPNGYMIDHIDRNPSNCSLSNLRLCNKSTNSINTGLRASNKTGTTGVCWDSRKERWRAYINFNGKRKELGMFRNKDEAIRVRKESEKIYHKEFIPLGSDCDS